jgi:hypothetical protein
LRQQEFQLSDVASWTPWIYSFLDIRVSLEIMPLDDPFSRILRSLDRTLIQRRQRTPILQRLCGFRFLVTATVVLLVLMVGLYALVQKAEPVYEGKRLSRWLQDLQRTNSLPL